MGRSRIGWSSEAPLRPGEKGVSPGRLQADRRAHPRTLGDTKGLSRTNKSKTRGAGACHVKEE